jgi:hypothetical protein
VSTALLTGIPRAGTTLTCALLNELPNTIALAEPPVFEALGDRAAALQELRLFIAASRASLLARGAAPSRHINGAVPDNWVMETAEHGLRAAKAELGDVRFDKKLTPEFKLFIKHPAEFLGLLDDLTPEYPVYGIVRHPLAVLASWQSVHMPVQDGHMPRLEACQPTLAAGLALVPGVLERQVMLLRFILTQLGKLPRARVIRYEDMIANPAQALAPLAENSALITRRLAPHDLAKRYPGTDWDVLAAALAPLQVLISRYY